MWKVQQISSSPDHLRFRIAEGNTVLSHNRFLNLLRNDIHFIEFYNKHLADCKFEAFFWENKPITQNNLEEDYECTLVESDFLTDVKPDTSTFNSYFRSKQDVVVLPNLGGDAKLVVPCPVSENSIYTQIGNFVRQAPKAQVKEFWRRVGTEMLSQLEAEPKWLSTSGLGVYWLHARVDSTPKYYQTQDYKTLES